MTDWLVVGAGFAGAVLAERIASQRGERVLVIDRRDHVGGNAADHHDAAGILVHRYGPHIFHTNSTVIHSYLGGFTARRPYEHRVLASFGGVLFPIPVNRTTINRFFGVALTSDAEVAAFLAARVETRPTLRTAEDAFLASLGRDLYDAFFRGYTRKQWGVDAADLDKDLAARVPLRTGTDDRYFSDRYQWIPADGYTRLFENMLDHPNIEVRLGADHRRIAGAVKARRVVYTGAIDEYFDFQLGRLPYRSIRFERRTLDQAFHQPVAVVNFPQDQDYTRVTEYKHITGQTHPRTSLIYEYPCADGDPFYPVPSPVSRHLYRRYRALADALDGVHFVGRLATYRYYNMDQIVGQALAEFVHIQKTVPVGGVPARRTHVG